MFYKYFNLVNLIKKTLKKGALKELLCCCLYDIGSNIPKRIDVMNNMRFYGTGSVVKMINDINTRSFVLNLGQVTRIKNIHRLPRIYRSNRIKKIGWSKII